MRGRGWGRNGEAKLRFWGRGLGVASSWRRSWESRPRSVSASGGGARGWEAGPRAVGMSGAGPGPRGPGRPAPCPLPLPLPPKPTDSACGPQVLGLCGAAYRPTEEIDLRSVGWGNIFQLPFKHVRDFRLRHLVPFFIYSGFEVLFACTGLALVSAGCIAFPDKIQDFR